MITYYFHVTKDSRIKYKIEENLFSLSGNLVISDFRTARLLSEKINSVRRDEGKFELQVTAGQINALGLLHEIFHLLIRKYEEGGSKNVFKGSLDFLKNNLTETELDKTLLKFVEEFPPLPVYQNKVKPIDYLKGKTEDKENREIILEELIILNLENINPATHQLKELYTDEKLANETKYKEIIEQTELFFESEPKIGGINLISFLRKPIIQSPYNIEEQLDFIRSNWSVFIDETILAKILSGKDLIHEDYKLFVQHGGGEKATPPVPSYEFDHKYFESLKQKLSKGKKLSPEEYEYYQLEVNRFTVDVDWMPRVVMIAKNAFVWMHQLTAKYGKEIKRLDEIPDAELDTLARWNFNALWLIGIWERSPASRKIKQMMGNPEAASSAYSLYDYVIANELGGDYAFENLKSRAWQRGIRLSSDMVPNHTGIYSKWVTEKPGYFIQNTVPPYPNYKFTGPNLSDDNRVEVRIEDQYYSRTDAAVVFERLDKFTGDRTYIYHGNDGTNMPWNDTAQLDLMKAEVRESLIQTIMHVARKTPIIRFDAAMTLAKKHFQRLWFPIPGSGGAIPSRAEYAMTRSQFDSIMPEEFWREVVDRINAEMPDTLLLAEAFWLMEGYFVRSLGMHRVYNSAFMHMFMKEENEKYKLLIKNTLTFNPEILKRYVNFMSNPDEETAINQFGKGDKYFGVATMLITLPGLPMFAHGQVEGLSEKYGMEYKRAYYTEFADDNLIKRHEKEIFPLTKKRYLFSQVDNFELYDFIDQYGICNENVFAFTNRSGKEVSLVVYNNSYYETVGAINANAERVYGEEGRTSTTNIDKALGINSGYGFYCIYKDHVQQLEYIVNCSQIASTGFSFHLLGYQRKVLLDFKEVYDIDGRYKILCDQLNGRGVDSIERALNEMNLAPFHNSLIHLFTSIKFSRLLLSIESNGEDAIEIPNLDEEIIRICNELNKIIKLELNGKKIAENIATDLLAVKHFFNLLDEISLTKRPAKWIGKINTILISDDDLINRKKLSFLLLNKILFNIFRSVEDKNTFRKTLNELLLWKPLFEIFAHLRFDDAGKFYELIKTLNSENLIYFQNDGSDVKTVKSKSDRIETEILNEYFNSLIKNDLLSTFIQVNEYEGIKYFNKERIEQFIKWDFILSIINNYSENLNKQKSSKKVFSELLKISYLKYVDVLDRISKSEYKIENLIKASEAKSIKKTDTKERTALKKITSKKKTGDKTKTKKVIKKKDTVTKSKKKLSNTKKTKTKRKAKPG
ncbi:MAG TPA: alpha-amylase family glycosyl hydrolase [Ignavibacteriaceae bacterium]|nr:alpha-amylase family glycosyl hydrolase [Ignavibacteriaceae bacterium]